MLRRLDLIASGLIALALLALAARPASAALIHEWRFLEGSGVSTADAVGTDTGSLASAPGWSTDVPTAVGTGYSLSFNGSSQSISLASAFTLNSSTDFSVSVWYKGTETRTGVGLGGSVTSGRGLVDWTGSIYADFVLDGGKLTYLHYDTTWRENVQAAPSVADGVWHNLVVVNHANQTADLFIDGTRQANGLSSAATGTQYTIDRFMVGYGDTYTAGKLADVRVYTNALTQLEVTALNVAAPVPEPADAALVLLGAASVLATLRRRGC